MVARAAARSLRPRLLPPPRRRIITPDEEWAVHGVAEGREKQAGPKHHAPIPPPVLRTARTPSPGGRKPPGRHTTPYLLATPQALRNSAERSGGAAGDEPR